MKKIIFLSLALFFTLGSSLTASATYDLALKKTIINHGPYDVGNTVQFTIEVINQGDEEAQGIRVTDYISSEFDLIDASWNQTGAADTGFFAEYEFGLIPAGESRTKTISYRITDRSESHIASHAEISRDDGDDCDSSPDRNILNDGVILDDYVGTGCENDIEAGEDDHDSAVITIKQRQKSRFNFVIRSGPSVRTSQRSYVVVNNTHYIPVSSANEYINVPNEDPFIEIPIDIVVRDYEFRNNGLEELEDFSGDLSTSYDVQNNEKLISFGNTSSGFIDVVGDDGNTSFYNTLINIAKSLKNLFYMIAGVFFLIIALRLIFASNTDEELGKFKKGVIWITAGLIVMQLALSFVTVGFDQGVSGEVGENIISIIVQPMILLLQTLASVFFMAVAIYAFYRLITANGNEEAIKSGKMTILYAIIGFMIVRFAGAIVNAFYGQVNCDASSSGSIVSTSEKICRNEADLGQGINIIMSIITWLNSFVALAVMLMIIYAGFQILLSGGDEEKIKKGKQAIVYVVIGIVILAINFLILTFFLDIDNIPVII